MEFIIWYFVIGVFATAVHNVLYISSMDEFEKRFITFNFPALLIQLVVWPLLILYWVKRIFNR